MNLINKLKVEWGSYSFKDSLQNVLRRRWRFIHSEIHVVLIAVILIACCIWQNSLTLLIDIERILSDEDIIINEPNNTTFNVNIPQTYICVLLTDAIWVIICERHSLCGKLWTSFPVPAWLPVISN